MGRAIANVLAKLAPEEPALFEHAIRFYAENVEASHKIMLGVAIGGNTMQVSHAKELRGLGTSSAS
jgi:hypothetical protein